MKEINIFNYSIMITFVFLIAFIPNVSAEDFQINEECIKNVLTLTIFDSEGPIKGVSAYIYKDLSMTKISDRVVSDNNGQITIDFSNLTVTAKISKEDHKEITKDLACIEEFRSQSMNVFSVVDSSVGIFEDPITKLTIVDLGSFYGIGGNGTIPDEIKVFWNNNIWKTINKETGIAPSTSHSEWQIPQTFFFNELPGKYKLVSITNNTETLVFEFIVKQITAKSEKNSLEINMNNNFANGANLINSELPPLKQIANGISPKDVTCKENMQLVFKITDDSPACLKSTTVDKLIERGWGKL